MEKWKRHLLNNSIFSSTLIVNQTFFTNWIYYWQTIFWKPNVFWYMWSLKILAIKKWFPSNLTKNLQGRHFVKGGPKNFKFYLILLLTVDFKTLYYQIYCCFYVFVILNLSRWYSIYEVTTLTARNFNNSRFLYHYFSEMSNFFPNIRFIKNVSSFNFEERATRKTPIFHLFKGTLFCNGRLYWFECWCVLRDFCRLSKKCSFATFPKL